MILATPGTTASRGIAISDVAKSFGASRALDGVSLDLPAGEIHALLGANGSGKSTLAKILSGVQLPDRGTISVGGRALPGLRSPHHASAVGIAVVHQDAPLIDTLSVAECIALFRGYPTARGGRVLWHRLRRDVDALLGRYGVHVSPDAIAGRLSGAERALVALVIALDQVARSGDGAPLELLILDEVTAALPERQAEFFLDRAVEIAGGGVAVLMITHRLAELNGRAEAATVLRGGRIVHGGAFRSEQTDALVAAMTGPGAGLEGRNDRNGGPNGASPPGLPRRVRPARARAGAGGDAVPALAFEAVGTSRLRNLSWSIGRGEIVGIAGLAESGIADVAAMLAGTCPVERGRILIDGHALPPRAKPWDTIGAGVTVLPADRLRDGGVRSLSVRDNAVLPATGRWWHRPRAERAALGRLARLLDIRPADPRAVFGTLSGGNQQKVVLGKWLLLAPSVLVLDDPTQGVDPAAREMIFAAVRDAASDGVAVLVMSTEPEQLARLCSRVLVLADEGATELRGAALSYRGITERCYA